ncbi:MerR family transcriptional regulator [Kribbella sp. CA-294648]|uniref:MerR family transcriptional regulator n=1 Tax=Kribbella sp. CA-294648 TaxID=3239948 RepID=UPI003D8EBA44
MNELYSIGELARRTGLTVKAIRFYSDRGLVPPTDRSPAGYRRYSLADVARLDLVRSLRELGLDLGTIRQVLDHELELADVAAAHAEALSVQIRSLRLRRAILTAVAERGSTPEELNLMHRLARLSDTERQHLLDDFLDSVFGSDPRFAGPRRTLTAELPDHPTSEQLDAWIELAELTQQPGFRDTVRQLVTVYPFGDLRRPDLVARIRSQAGSAMAAGIAPDSAEARPIATAIVSEYQATVGADSAEPLIELLTRANDPRWARYLELLAIINEWAPPEPLAPTYEWAIGALSHAG